MPAESTANSILDRSGKRPESFLKGFTGCLVTDGYAGYSQVQKVTHCGYWAHARRKWREAMPDGATVKTSKAALGFQYCTKLFSLEKKYVYADGKGRKDYRQNVVWPLLEKYFAWLKRSIRKRAANWRMRCGIP